MCARIQSTLVAGLLLVGSMASAAPAYAQGDAGCWDLAYAAVRQRAAAMHPSFITYDAVGTIIQDGAVLTRVREAVAYRDDGVALVADDRFERPYVTRKVDPGPPELGPYAGRRTGWLLPEEMDPSLRVIAKVNAAHRESCTNEGVVRYDDRDVYHLVFGAGQQKPGLREMWVDVQSRDIWKVILRGNADALAEPVAQIIPVDFAIELEQSGPYFVVRHISWKYEVKEDSQLSRVFGEYYYNDFRFPDQLPSGYFES